MMHSPLVVSTWWYTMDGTETDLWNHADSNLQTTFRRVMIKAIARRATMASERYRRVVIYDCQENLVVEAGLDEE
jgi:hypothetical protein